MTTVKTKILIILFVVGLTTPLFAQVQQVILRVDGLACPFCAYGLEKKLKKLEGVEDFDIKINEGKVILTWKKDKPLNIENIDNAVENAGFTLRGVEGNFIGRIVKEDEKMFLVLDSPTKQRLYLYETSAITKKTKLNLDAEASYKSFSDTMLIRLESLALKAVQVRIKGPVRAHRGKEQPMGLGIEKITEREVFEGVLIKENGRILLSVEEPSEQQFSLYEADKLKLTDRKTHKLESTNKAFTEEKLEQLEKYLSQGRKVIIIGKVHSHQPEDTPPAIAIDELRVKLPEISPDPKNKKDQD